MLPTEEREKAEKLVNTPKAGTEAAEPEPESAGKAEMAELLQKAKGRMEAAHLPGFCLLSEE